MNTTANANPGADPAAAGQPVSFTLRAVDGYPLAAMRYAAQGAERGRLIVAGATGVPQGFYRRFAQFAAAHGYTVLTLDYRGIGASRSGSLRGFRASFLDWGRLDLAAAVDHMADDGATAGASAAPGAATAPRAATTSAAASAANAGAAPRAGRVPLYMVGHSYGGHAFGLLPNHGKVDGLYTFATGAGWHGWMPRLERVRVLLMWNVVAPLLTRWKGCLAWSKLGMGEDLPLGVYRQWKHWCGYPHYFFDDPKMRDVTDGFNDVRAPIMAVNAADDLWAPPGSRDAFMRGYRNAPWFGIDIDPAKSGIGKIGHMGYFRPQAQALWVAALDWFDGIGARSPAAHPPV
ncbi:alpha/beta hydrolase family protein [Pseudoduganella namucuonensis]|uniref:Predicted alpha/beta hydrolase n=1 Tax=Pseudoduganella namucuonensis TaxID=1035707 RepID=A0A1I7KZA5_9BURK|nr:alpha/beta fold hydrolase [Pseudoduganella namucuonensis]SFV02777.1 Predicted alpha/beta hydrolase [Pseudoduganella namucuonensis]